jgi:hypothetical protein
MQPASQTRRGYRSNSFAIGNRYPKVIQLFSTRPDVESSRVPGGVIKSKLTEVISILLKLYQVAVRI